MSKTTTHEKNASTLRDDVKAVRNDAEEVVSDAYSAVRRAADEAIDDVTKQGDELVHSVKTYVANRPLTSLAIAAAAGFIFGKVWR